MLVTVVLNLVSIHCFMLVGKGMWIVIFLSLF
jgi:hypothetical protein